MKKNNFTLLRTFIILIFTALSLFSCSEKKDQITFNSMDTYMSIRSYGKNAAKADRQARETILELENIFSTTKEQSDIYKLNHNQEQTLFVKPQTQELVNFALSMAFKTDGALNPCLYPVTSAWGFTTGNYEVPSQAQINLLLQQTDFRKVNLTGIAITLPQGMMLDLGAVAKGYAGDRAIEVLKENGVSSALLDLGGNIQTLGGKPDGSDWTIGIKNPWGGDVAASLKIKNQAVITSGGYERYFTENGKKYIHIFDGKTGYPVENNLESVTVVSGRGVYGDALSTALFVMGKEKAQKFWKNNQDFEMIIITGEGDTTNAGSSKNENNGDRAIYYTKGLSQKIKILDPNLKCVVLE